MIKINNLQMPDNHLNDEII